MLDRIEDRCDYRQVAASSNLDLGGAGCVVQHVVIVPATTSPGEVKLVDGSGGGAVDIVLLKAGTVGDLRPIHLTLGLKPTQSVLNLACGANVSAIAIGRFRP